MNKTHLTRYHVIALLTVLALFIAITSRSAKGEDALLWKNVGAWSIRIDTTLNNSCFVYAVYEGNTVIRIGFDKEAQNLYVMIGDVDWKSLEQGKEYAINIRFGNETPWVGKATAVTFNDLPVLTLIISGFDSEKQFIEEFMRETSMRVEYQNKTIASLTLKGSFKAGTALLECQKAADAAQKDSDPFRGPDISPKGSPAGNHDDPFAI